MSCTYKEALRECGSRFSSSTSHGFVDKEEFCEGFVDKEAFCECGSRFISSANNDFCEQRSKKHCANVDQGLVVVLIMIFVNKEAGSIVRMWIKV